MVILVMVSRPAIAGTDDLGVSVVFGWQGQMPAERWAPITVLVSPGESALAGMIITEYQQGPAGDARISVPFAATPNVTTPIHVIVNLPDNCSRVALALVDDRGRELWRQSFESISGGFAQTLPILIDDASPLMVLVGRSTLFESTRDWPAIVTASNIEAAGRAPRASLTDEAWTHVAAGRADESSLPSSWTAYDGIGVMVVTPDPMAPPDVRGVEAVHQWVESGGRLAVRVDAPGEAWRAWVPGSMSAEIEVGEARPVGLPDIAATAIRDVAGRMRLMRESPDGASGIAGASAPLPVAAASVIARHIRTPDRGWTTHLTSEGGSVVVEGAYGFGAIMLIGFDPAKTTETMSTIGSGAVWRAVLTPLLSDVLDEVSSRYGDRRWNWTAGRVGKQQALNAGLESIASVSGVGTSVFIVIVASVLALAILVGPCDYFALRRLRMLQRSWLTALVWLGIASLAAFTGPKLVRTESTRVNRLSVDDCIVEPVTGAGPQASVAPGGPVAFRFGLTGIYAGEEGIAEFAQVDRASWWRGAGVKYINQTPIIGSGVVPIVQQAAGGARGSQRGGPLERLPLGLWTFRTLADESSPPAAIRATVRARDGGWSALLAGLPEGIQVTRAALRVETLWVTPTFEPRLRTDSSGYSVVEPSPPIGGGAGTLDGGLWSCNFPAEHGQEAIPAAWGEVDVDPYGTGEVAGEDRPGVLLRLPGADRRERGIERHLAAGGHAALYLEVKNWPVETPMQWSFTGEHTRILRVVAPLIAK